MIDINTLIGPYPYRHVPHPEPAALRRVLERENLSGAWVGHLPSAFHRDPTAGNAELYTAVADHAPVLRPVPTIRSDWPRWDRTLVEARDRGAPAVRAYPSHWGWNSGAGPLEELAIRAGDLGMAVLLTVRFEDLRQRHPFDVVSDLPAATVRSVARSGSHVRLVVTAASRELIEEVHWGLTPEEQSRVFWDISWVWGPPEDHLAKLFRTIGASRFVFGSQWPLRLVQGPRANLDLLPDDLRDAKLADVDRLCATACAR